MNPNIIILGRTIPAYGLMSVTGFLLALVFIAVFSRKDRIRLENAIYIFSIGSVGALIGAKLIYILTVFPDFIQDIQLISSDKQYFIGKYVTGGLVFFGGLTGGILAAWLAAKSYKVRFSSYFDILVPSVIITAMFGRIGCFMAGCCYGKETSSPLGVTFHHSIAGANNLPLFPTQLFEALFNFVILVVIFILIKRGLKGTALLERYLFSYSVFRFLNEFLRGDAERGFILDMSVSQWISLLVLALLTVRRLCFEKNNFYNR